MIRRRTNRRAFLSGALIGLAGVPPVSGTDAGASPKARLTGISPAGGPVADGYTPDILIEGGQKMVFVSGRGPRDRKADMETQIHQTLEAIGKVLGAAGASLKDVVILRAYFVNLQRDLPAYRKVRKEYFSKPYPASTSIGVTALALPDLEVEIEAVAVF
jgi:enamine deaminase RidA (YjgF/YER057c/UK114 family)